MLSYFECARTPRKDKMKLITTPILSLAYHNAKAAVALIRYPAKLGRTHGADLVEYLVVSYNCNWFKS
jgi:hypothetical protein